METGAIPIRCIVKNRRVSYLKHILSRDKQELLSRVYFSQKRRPLKDDWALIVNKDMEEMNINNNEEIIKNMKKVEFKRIMKKATEEAAFNFLSLKQKTHSKVRDITYSGLKIQSYLKSNLFTTEEKQFLFKLRTAMSDVKVNFNSMFLNVDCDLCDLKQQQTVQHILSCPDIRNNCPAVDTNIDVQFKDIFHESELRQLNATKLIKEAFETKWRLQDKSA